MSMKVLERRFPLGSLPTPLEKLHRLSGKYAPYQLYIKRDDNTGLASGGNKTRKLEFLIEEAIINGYDTTISAGAQQSNHCRQTAAASASAGLQCHLLLGGSEPKEYEGNLLLSSLLGAKIHFCGKNRKGEDMPALMTELERQGRRPFPIPYGGSNPRGVLGFVLAVKELEEQLESLGLQMDHIFFASSSGGTQAGLSLGLELFELESRLHAISIDKEDTHGRSLEARVYELVKGAAELLGFETKITPEEIELNHQYDGAGYGVLTTGELRAIKELAQEEGILLDPVYTGRAWRALADHLEQEKLALGSNILFWHTGGLPSLFGYMSSLSMA